MLFSFIKTILSQVLGIPHTFVSLGVMLVSIVSGAKSIAGLLVDFKFFGQGRMFGMDLEFPVILTFILFVIVCLVIKKTYFGRHVIVLGGNKNAARLAASMSKGPRSLKSPSPNCPLRDSMTYEKSWIFHTAINHHPGQYFYAQQNPTELVY